MHKIICGHDGQGMNVRFRGQFSGCLVQVGGVVHHLDGLHVQSSRVDDLSIGGVFCRVWVAGVFVIRFRRVRLVVVRIPVNS